MQLALVNDRRVEPFPSGRAICPHCGSEMIAKCGPRVLHHWAHYRQKQCDVWWENETQWHRDWKNLFPIECREISHTADDGEIHRADIKTPTGIVIEVQHSPMTDVERQSREFFYQNLVWVIDGSAFIDNFDIYHPLPDPDTETAQDIVWAKAKRHQQGANRGIFFRLSEARKENPKIRKSEINFGWVHDISEIAEELNESYSGYHQYDWVRPRKTWIDSKFPVYIDFGRNLLAKFETYDESGLKCIRYVSKQKFLHDAMNEEHATDIATRFHQLP